MSSIGSFTFLRLSGAKLPTKAMTTAIIDRPGVDGVGFRYNALKVGQQTIETEEGVTSIDLAKSRPDDYAGIKGTTVTVVDDLGRSVASVLVIEAVVTSVQKVLSVSGGSGITHIVRASWILQPTG